MQLLTYSALLILQTHPTLCKARPAGGPQSRIHQQLPGVPRVRRSI